MYKRFSSWYSLPSAASSGAVCAFSVILFCPLKIFFWFQYVIWRWKIFSLDYICGAYSEFTSDVLPRWRPGYDVRQERLLYIFHYSLISSAQDFPEAKLQFYDYNIILVERWDKRRLKFSVHAVKAYAGVEVNLHSFLTSKIYVDNGQTRTPAAFP
jgi:hypothetical protein